VYPVSTTEFIPQGGTAEASINTYDTGVASDVDSVTVVWKDQSGVTLATQTYTSSDVSGVTIYGDAVSLTNPAGTGTYVARMLVNVGSYSPTAAGLRWTVTITAVKGGQSSAPLVYPFYIVPSTVTLALDSTAITAAVLRQTGFYKDVMHVARDTNALITLSSNIVYGIVSAFKNGVAITNGVGYTWSLYRTNVTAIPAPAINDHYLFTIQTRSDASVSDLVGRYTEEVIADLQHHFATTALLQSPTVAGIIRQLTIGEIRMENMQGASRGSATYDAALQMVEAARRLVLRIQRGEATIFDTAGVAIPRVDGAIVGSFLHEDGDFGNRLGLLNRAEAASGIYVHLTPNPILLSSRRPTFEV
jgi:hypothetical protein